MDVRSIRGTHDILPGSVELWQHIEATARHIFRLYGFAEIRTPIIEERELFARSIGAETDIVQKEMYTFSDSRGKKVTLRPEGTAPVVRSYVEKGLARSGEVNKLYYIGPMFRHERPQKGRYRQFHQIGAEVLGSDDPAIEAEVIEMLERFLTELGLREYRLLVNSVGCSKCRPPYLAQLRQELHKRHLGFCEQCRGRTETNPLRVFDCKVPSCQPLIEELPRIADSLCRQCATHFGRFLDYLQLLGIAYEKAPRLVRGLDYYVRTTFEIVNDRLGPTQNALLGGGRYDGLSEILGGPPAKGFGFALGLERFVLLLSKRERIEAEYRPPQPMLMLAYFDEPSFRECLKLAGELREQGIEVYVDFQRRSLKAQMRLANRLRARFSCVVGEDEMRSGRFSVKRMSDGHEEWLERNRLSLYLKSESDNAGAREGAERPLRRSGLRSKQSAGSGE